MRNDLLEAKTTYFEGPQEGGLLAGGGYMAELGKDFKKTFLDFLVG